MSKESELPDWVSELVEKSWHMKNTYGFVSDLGGLLIEEVERLRAELAECRERREETVTLSDRLQMELEACREHQERLAWNLAGCLTIAESETPQDYDPGLALPAIVAVNNLVGKLIECREKLAAAERIDQQTAEELAKEWVGLLWKDFGFSRALLYDWFVAQFRLLRKPQEPPAPRDDLAEALVEAVKIRKERLAFLIGFDSWGLCPQPDDIFPDPIVGGTNQYIGDAAADIRAAIKQKPPKPTAAELARKSLEALRIDWSLPDDHWENLLKAVEAFEAAEKGGGE